MTSGRGVKQLPFVLQGFWERTVQKLGKVVNALSKMDGLNEQEDHGQFRPVTLRPNRRWLLEHQFDGFFEIVTHG
jgi:hypothetical protein